MSNCSNSFRVAKTFDQRDLLKNKSADRETVSSGPSAANHDAALDLRGLRCPLPALKIRKALRGLPPGAVLAATCDDPLAVVDVPNLVREDGHALIRTEGVGSVMFLIRSRTP